MTQEARGVFEVKLTPRTPDSGEAERANIGRMSLDKSYRGDLEAASSGEMLGVRTGIDGSAGYVAMERVDGTLHGREGTFVLQHNGLMNRGLPDMRVVVVPDSGTGELAGLSGALTIEIADGKHSYRFEYDLPDAP